MCELYYFHPDDIFQSTQGFTCQVTSPYSFKGGSYLLAYKKSEKSASRTVREARFAHKFALEDRFSLQCNVYNEPFLRILQYC